MGLVTPGAAMRTWIRERSTLLAAGMIGAYVLGVAPSLGQPLLESHAYRQTQTAFTAVLFAERGVDLLRPPLPVLGPPGVLPLEFPLFQAIGSLVMLAGAQADLAMRLTGLACFVASAVLLFALARYVSGPLAAIVALGAFLFNAHAWLYGRTSLIEYLATAGGLAFLYFGIRWLDGRSRAAWVAALVGGSIGILVKVTTGVFYLLPLLLWRTESGRWGYQRPATWLLIGGVGGVGAAWSLHADAIRAAQPATEFLATHNQYGWLFGSLEQRLDPASWRIPLVAGLMLTGFGLIAWAFLAVRGAAADRQRRFLSAMLLLVLVMPIVLFNLYAIHDYYWVAVAPFVALGVGVGAAWILSRWPVRWARLLTVGLAGAWVATLVGTAGTWTRIYGSPDVEKRTMAVASFIRQNSEPEDWVVLDGYGWNSTFLYYARRQGFAVPDETTEQGMSNLEVEAILRDPIYGPFFTCDPQGVCVVSQTR